MIFFLGVFWNDFAGDSKDMIEPEIAMIDIPEVIVVHALFDADIIGIDQIFAGGFLLIGHFHGRPYDDLAVSSFSCEKLIEWVFAGLFGSIHTFELLWDEVVEQIHRIDYIPALIV